MTHEEQRAWLIEKLVSEDDRYKNMEVPVAESEQKTLLRALMNVRMPAPISDEFARVQDEYLSEVVRQSEIVDVRELEHCQKSERIVLWQGDITCLKVDAIVNAANSQMCGCFQPNHNCIDNIIHTKSGIQLRLTCYDIMQKQGHEEPTGKAKITPAYNLPCDYVIHTVGPIVRGSLTKNHEDLLASCYKSCLDLAAENGVTSIAFCCISTGVFMFPNERAAEIAVETVTKWLGENRNRMQVVFNVFKDIDFEIYDKLLN